MSLSKLGIVACFKLIFDKGIEQVPTLSKIGVCVQESTSKIWNSLYASFGISSYLNLCACALNFREHILQYFLYHVRGLILITLNHFTCSFKISISTFSLHSCPLLSLWYISIDIFLIFQRAWDIL